VTSQSPAIHAGLICFRLLATFIYLVELLSQSVVAAFRATRQLTLPD
jgi:hypothetical protein